MDVDKLYGVAITLVEGMDRALARRGLSRARAGALRRLVEHGPLTQRRLASLLDCSPRNVTALLDVLERDGLVTRRGHPDDRRAVLVDLTEAGTRTVTEVGIDAGGLGDDADAALARLPTSDLAAFARVLDVLHATCCAPTAPAPQ